MKPPNKGHGTSETPTSARKDEAADGVVTNRAGNTVKASRLANLLEGMRFPATKNEIRAHLDAKMPSTALETADIRSSLEHYLEEDVVYANTYDIELAVGFVRPEGADDTPPYARDKALKSEQQSSG